MSVRILSKTQSVGIIGQPKTTQAATAYLCAGGTEFQWTNPAVAGTNFRTIYPDASTVIPDPMPNHDYYNTTSQNGALMETERFHTDSTTGLKKLSMNGVLWKNDAAPMLTGALQAVSEDGGTPYEKTFTSGFISGLLDFGVAGDQGYLHSMAMRTISGSNTGALLTNGVVDRLELTWDFNAQGVARNLRYSVDWVFANYTPDTTLSGTWATTTREPFNDDDTFSFGTLTSDEVDLSAITVRRFTFTVNNNVTVKTQSTAGAVSNFDMRPKYTGTLLFDFTSTNRTLTGDYQAGANVDITVANDIGSGTDNYFSLDCPYGVLTSNPYQYEGDFAAMQMNVEFQSHGGATPVTIVMDDTQDWGY